MRGLIDARGGKVGLARESFQNFPASGFGQGLIFENSYLYLEVLCPGNRILTFFCLIRLLRQ